MKTQSWLLLLACVVAQASPTVEENRRPDAPGQNIHKTGEPPAERTIFAVLSLIYMTVLSLLLGFRVGRQRNNGIWKRNITSMLVLGLFFIVMAFIISTTALVAGQGLDTGSLCNAVGLTCVVCYTLAKSIIYLFFIERIHVVRAPFFPRSRDWIYITCMILVFVIFVVQFTNTFLRRDSEMQQRDGRCHMGIWRVASIMLLTIDVVSGLGLTGLFFYLLHPVTKAHGSALAPAPGVSRSGAAGEAFMAENNRFESAIQRNIRILLRKSIIGGFLIVTPTIANMIQLVITEVHELAIICLSICMLDVTLNTVVVNWLTFGSSAEAERNLTRLTQDRMQTLQGQSSPPTTSSGGDGRDGELGLEIATHGLLREPAPQVAATSSASELDTSPG
ncbi:nnrS protein domain-containing protein [Pochonia chlamydosporia 170]|uniref:NnrS protein domain-containing protein n=1 Tax=Pochonia chlamydosporia 170 TaxID=1380566 RepID=A0A179FFZ5_METCM|nr:nnrS protein domain-containing protein [Pochonia chlamydosporia 170]OAQ64454.1 nnrS protein domain-containing protein [Pochonia chlamydosporia 170]